MKQIKLVLADETEIPGKAFGATTSATGEIVISTAMTGYPENLTDPSFRGQIQVLTYPVVGNYGVPAQTEEDALSKLLESETIHIAGIVSSVYSYTSVS